MQKNVFFPHPESASGIQYETLSEEDAEKEWEIVMKWAQKQDKPPTIKWMIFPSDANPPLLWAEWSLANGESRPKQPII